MKYTNICVLLFLIIIENCTPKLFPNNIIIPKIQNKNIPVQTLPEEYTNNENENLDEPILKASPEINLPAKDFTLIESFKVLPSLFIDKKDSAYDGLSLIAECLKSDMNRVIGEKVDDEGKAVDSDNSLKITTDNSNLSGQLIIAGTFGENGNDIINQLIKDGSIDTTDLENRWESYLMQVIRKPLEGVDEALVIVGSDKRGTIYGMFHISEMMGVSPWVWWADVLPETKDRVVLPGKECNLISKEPSIKYRGIFLNDEAPSLTTWTDKRYGGRNQYFYNHVYELLLRLKANYLWPAMWGDIFSEGGKEDKQANAKMANQYGIVMGTSHHEPCYRAGNEWGGYYKNDLGMTSAQAWNKYNIPGQQGYDARVNKEIEQFWEDGVKRNKDYDNICTVGMRGEADSTLPSANNPSKYAELLNYIINTQKKILENQSDKHPTQLVIYKEVENAWYAGSLFDKDCMKDTYAMFCDDNWSYIRTMPTLEQQSKIAGLGMYYHFDYVGAPKSYTWVQNTQISRVWDQMSISYDYGIDDVWIVNVGDLKPMELDISYFLDLAYNYEYYGVNGHEKLEEYKKNWALQQFYRTEEGKGLSEEDCEEVASLIDRYLDLQSKRKVEHVLYDKADGAGEMFSVDNYRDALSVLEECEDIMERIQILNEKVPEELKAAFYQLVYYPGMAVPNVLRIQIYAALNIKFANLGLAIANEYANRCKGAIELDNQLFKEYNEKMPGTIEHGTKWNGMISCGQKYHIGLQRWDRDSGVLPNLKNVQVNQNDNTLIILVESFTNSFKTLYTKGEASLPSFNKVANETYEVKIGSKGGKYNFEISTNDDWIIFRDNKKGDPLSIPIKDTVNQEKALFITIDWDKVKETSKGSFTVTSGQNKVQINIQANVNDLTDIEPRTYVMTQDFITMDVAHYFKLEEGKGVDHKGEEVGNKMIIIPDNGKFLTALRTNSSVITYEKAEDLKNAPYAEYKVFIPGDGQYNLQLQFNPTSNLIYGKTRLRYGISIDNGNIDIVNSIVNDYLAGTWQQGTWSSDIEFNSRRSYKNNINLNKGVHTIRYYQCDPNLALIRMTLYKGKLANVYGSPEEGAFVE